MNAVDPLDVWRRQEVSIMTIDKKPRPHPSHTTKRHTAQPERQGGARDTGTPGGARMTPRGDERRRSESHDNEAFDAAGSQRPPSDS